MSASAAELRYVVLRHEGFGDAHFDLMFESSRGSPLMTWRSPVWPLQRPTPLTKLPDHRQEYLQYEGEISRNRGSVRRVDSGICRISSVEGGGLVIRLVESKEHLKLMPAAEASDQWLCTPLRG